MYGYGGPAPVDKSKWEEDARAKDQEQQRLLMEKKIAVQNEHLKAATRPDRPEFESVLGEDGLLQDKYAIEDRGDVNVNTDVMNEIKKRGLSEGPTAWGSTALAKQGVDEANQRDYANQDFATGQNMARASMSMRGGMGSGAGERLATQGLRGLRGARQGVRRQGQLDRYGIDLKDIDRKDNFLQQAQSNDWKQADLDGQNRLYHTELQAKNLDQGLRQRRLQNADGMDAYKEEMSAWAADKESKASAGGGGK